MYQREGITMNKIDALEYVLIAIENRIKQRIENGLENNYTPDQIMRELEYYQQVRKYLEENLK